MNILITGIHGFVGSNLVSSLKGRHTLYGLDIVTPVKDGVVKTFSWKDIEPTSFPLTEILAMIGAVPFFITRSRRRKNETKKVFLFSIFNLFFVNQIRLKSSESFVQISVIQRITLIQIYR